MDIIIGKFSFNAQYLKSITKAQAMAEFKHIDKRVVEEAYKKANPKSAKRKAPKKSEK